MGEKGLVSKIQRYSTKDGPGLRSTVFMVGCNLACKWCANPELIAQGKKVMYDRVRCQKCGRCVAKATPSGVLSMAADGVHFCRQSWENMLECVEGCFYDALELIGTEMDSAELAEKLLRDKVFYQQSGGGVTFSGGEAALQADFVAETARQLQENGCSVALDTAGCVSWSKLEKILQHTDTVLYDIKAFDSSVHRSCTGVDNKLILENAKKISLLNKDMYIRMVIVPRMNDQWEDILQRLQFVKELGDSVKQVDLLKYHTLGQGKYIRLGMEYPLQVPSCDEEFIAKIYEAANDMGLRVTVGG